MLLIYFFQYIANILKEVQRGSPKKEVFRFNFEPPDPAANYEYEYFLYIPLYIPIYPYWAPIGAQ